jgi:hypothetical protein
MSHAKPSFAAIITVQTSNFKDVPCEIIVRSWNFRMSLTKSSSSRMSLVKSWFAARIFACPLQNHHLQASHPLGALGPRSGSRAGNFMKGLREAC